MDFLSIFTTTTTITSWTIIVTYMAYIMIIFGILSFIGLQYLRAPYGKYVNEAGIWYGPLINGRLAWILQETPSFLIPAYMWYLETQQSPNKIFTSITPNTILLTAFLAHYLHRSFIFPLRLTGGKPTPFIIALMAFIFCVFNGCLQGITLTKVMHVENTEIWEPHFILGLIIFIIGAFINIHADTVLLNLRKPGDTGYYIPRGGAFELVSGANFFGEIIEWLGWAIACNTLSAYAFAFFTFCNIGPRGAQHHLWLKQKFGDKYPRKRYAVIPFIW